MAPAVIDALVLQGHSPSNGARFLKRVIDDRIKLPISQQWREANTFHASLDGTTIIVHAVGPRLVASNDPDAAVAV